MAAKHRATGLLAGCALLLIGCRQAAPDLTQRSDFQDLIGLCLEAVKPLDPSAIGQVIYLSPVQDESRFGDEKLVPVGRRIRITGFRADSGFDGMWYHADGTMRIGERDFQVELGRLLDADWYWAAQQAATNGRAPVGGGRNSPPINRDVVRLCPGTEAAPAVTSESPSKIQGTKKP